MSGHDAIVIGSGPNGLSAAITLAQAGRSVLVLERAERPGGAVATEELTLPGFRHDAFSAVYPAAAASPVFARLPLAEHGLRWVHPRLAMAHVLDDGEAAALARDPHTTAETLDRLHPGDGERYASFVEPWVRHSQALRRTMLSGFPPLRGPAELVARAGLTTGLELVRLLLIPAAGLAQELFRSPAARAWLYGSAMHGDAPPDAAGSGIAAIYLNVLGHVVGWPSPEGGAGRLTDALVGVLRSLGGELRCSAPVTGVVVERGRAAGVEAGGERLSARIVIADTSPRGLLALAAFPAGYEAALRRFRHGMPTLKVDWALAGPIPWTAPEATAAGTVHVGGEEDEVLRATASFGGLPERPFMLCGQQSVHDPSRTPDGRHTAWAYTHGPHAVDWAAETPRHVERMEAQIERFAPGFRDLVLARHVLGPADLEARNPNLVHGDVGGGSYSLDQVVFRPRPSLMPYRTPVHGLYLGSASAFPGGAVHGVPGHAAARLALALDRRPLRWMPRR